MAALPMKPSAADIAQTAGWVEAEGSILLPVATYRNGTLPCIFVKVAVVNTERVVLDWLQAKWSGTIYGKTRRGALGQKPIYQWIVTGPTAVRLLEAIYPRLLGVKRQRAAKALEFYGVRRAGPQGGPIPASQRADYDRIYREFRAIA